jgi:hypothetical protein
MISPKLFQKYAADPAAFRADLTVDVNGLARRFGDVQDPWQKVDFLSIDPALMVAIGRDPDAETVKKRFYLERPRGHSKTTDIAIVCVYALAFATRPLRGYAYAADRDQAKILRDAMANVIRMNPWLADLLTVETYRVVNSAKEHPGAGGELTIESSSVATSYGILPNLVVCDELCHWQGDGSLWHSIISSAAKRTDCLLLAISNAGFIDSWVWAVREAARTDEAWIFSRLDGPQASWLSAQALSEQQRMLPPLAYARLWQNVWSASGGDALSPADIAAAFDETLAPMTGSESGWLFVAGVDLGLTRDHTAVVVLAVPVGGTAGHIRLADVKVWRPEPGRKIDLMAVERHILSLDDRYGLESVGFDPWQAELMGQRLEADTEHKRRNQRRRYGSLPWMRELSPTPANLREQASLTIECFQDRRLRLHPCPALKRDLCKLRVEERPSGGFRLTSPRDGEGHGDCASAFMNALVLAHEYSGKRPVVAGSLDYGPPSAEPSSPLDLALRQFDLDAQAFAQEQEGFIAGDDHDHQATWNRAMAEIGRAAYESPGQALERARRISKLPRRYRPFFS